MTSDVELISLAELIEQIKQDLLAKPAGSQYHLDKGSRDWYAKRGVARDALDLPVVGVYWEDAVAY